MKYRNKLVFALLLTLMLLLTTACGAKEPCALAGNYPLLRGSLGSVELSYADMQYAGMTDGTYMSITEDYKGEFCFSGEDPASFKIDMEASVLDFGLGTKYAYSVEGDTISVTIPEDDMILVFAREGSDAFNSTDSTILGSLGVEGASVPIPSDWYGYALETDFSDGRNSEFRDVFGYFREDGNGKAYFDVYLMDAETCYFSMYMTIEDFGLTILPDIGDKDAFIIDTYLTAEDTEDYTGFCMDGMITFNLPYENDEGVTGSIILQLREWGAEWNEDSDVLPPSYEEYKTTIGG